MDHPPAGPLLRDNKGNLYGTTAFGGAFGFGTVFKLDTNGTEIVPYSFAGGKDGARPLGGVIRDSSNNFYGTTDLGGILNQGTIFKLARGRRETVLHRFSGANTAQTPTGASFEIPPEFVWYDQSEWRLWHRGDLRISTHIEVGNDGFGIRQLSQ